MLNWAGYARLLAGFFRFQVAIGAVSRSHGLDRFSGASGKAELLRADLAALGAAVQSSETVFAIPSTAHALGALYVAEGSMFGGKVIAGQLRYLLSGESDGTSFFRGTRQDAPRWKSLVRKLETYSRDEEAVSAMIKGAQMAFQLFEECVTLAPIPVPGTLKS